MKDKTYVWDPLVRIFHWALLIAFITSYISGENEWGIHQYSGYLIVGLITFRVLWGFFGSKHARFSDFVRPLPETIAYLKGLFSSEESGKHFIGHNPAGGLMIVALLLSLFFTTFSGLKLYGAEGHGPFAVAHEPGVEMTESGYAKEHDDKHEAYEKHESDEHESDDHDEAYEDEEAEEFWEEIHEFFIHFTLILIILHVVGVVLSSRKHKENLVRAMITGYKEKQENE